jgi:hypothetical protein
VPTSTSRREKPTEAHAVHAALAVAMMPLSGAMLVKPELCDMKCRE